MAVVNYKDEISKSTAIIKKFRKDRKLFDNEKAILELERNRYKMYYSQIHQYLAPKKTQQAEEQIQDLVKDVFAIDLPICEAKVKRFTRALKAYEAAEDVDKLNLCYKYLQEWLGLYEGNFALVAFRSLEHFALYLEWDKPEKNKVWKPSLDPYNDNGYTGISKPFFYFFNQMVLKREIKFISKQMFTGAGKSYSNQFAFAWLLGIDPDNDILDVLGNPALVLTNTKGTVEIIKNVRFAKVFPFYAKYIVTETYKTSNGEVKTKEVISDDIFSTCRIKDGELTLADSSKPLNLKVISKQTSIDGIRVRYLFLDDVCRSVDANNLKQHQIDIDNFWNSWWKRNYGTDDFFIVVGGTAYSVHDILSHLIAYYSKGKMRRTAVNKYSYESLDGKAVFIKIPKIDYDFNRSTYPQKFPYDEAIKIRERNLASFLAMEQQEPQNPETSPLSYDKLRTYDELPSDLSKGAIALLDPARSGKNYVAMGIHRTRKETDKFGAEIEVHYLTDCIFELKLMEDVYGEICDKIEQHHIVRLHIENNTDTSLRFLIEKMLHERGITFCVLTESFSSEVKDEKMKEIVYSSEGYIRNQMRYPSMAMYPPSSQMGKFMLYFTAYDYYRGVEFDDSIDEECMYIERFVAKKKDDGKAKLIYV